MAATAGDDHVCCCWQRQEDYAKEDYAKEEPKKHKKHSDDYSGYDSFKEDEYDKVCG